MRSSEGEQEERDDGARYQEYGDDQSVAHEFVGHVDASEGRGEEADGDEKEKDLHREMRLLWRLGGWLRGGGVGMLVGLRYDVGGAGFVDGDGGGLFLVELGEGCDPGGRLVVAAARGLMQAEGLEGAGEGEE